MICPFCNQEHSDDTRFCPKTGEKIERLQMCQECNAVVPEDAIFCPECGNRVSHKDLAVDLGLSVKWATCNFGSDDFEHPENNKYFCSLFLNSGISDAWGAHWRQPTAEEFNELISKCDLTPSSKNGVKGITVKGPNGNSIFMPADYNEDREGNYKWLGVYFSCTTFKDDIKQVYAFAFVPSTKETLITTIARDSAIMIRPVFDEQHAYLSEGIEFGDGCAHCLVYGPSEE